jgi:hypothetical protein
MRGNPYTAGKSHSGFTECYVMKITRGNVKPRGKAQSLKHFKHPTPHWVSAVDETISPSQKFITPDTREGKFVSLGAGQVKPCPGEDCTVG